MEGLEIGERQVMKVKLKYFLSQKEDNFQEDNLKVMSMNLNSFR